MELTQPTEFVDVLFTCLSILRNTSTFENRLFVNLDLGANGGGQTPSFVPFSVDTRLPFSHNNLLH